MKPTQALLAATTALAFPAVASAAQVTLTTQVKSYWGPPAYLAIYLTDPNGKYVETLHVAGGSGRYWSDLRAWYAGFATSGSDYGALNGLTGASVGGGRTLKVSVDVADALIDAGYQIHVDSAIEHMGQVAPDVTVPLAAADAGQTVTGRGFVDTFRFDL